MPKLIAFFLILNLILIFSTIYVTNKTRDIEKKNNYLISEISKISLSLKINKIELVTHQNSSYLKKLYDIYISEKTTHNYSNIVSIKEFNVKNKNIKLINSEN